MYGIFDGMQRHIRRGKEKIPSYAKALLDRGSGMSLTDVFLRGLKPDGTIQKHTGSGGLYLFVSPAGGRLWRLDYRFAGKRKTLSFGAYPTVSLKDARSRREEARELIARGIDPGEQKKQAKAERYTFEAAGKRWYEHHAEETVPATHKKSRMYLDALNKRLGGRALPELDRKTLVDAVQAIQGELSIHFAQRKDSAANHHTAGVHIRDSAFPGVYRCPAVC
ncbi:MAG: Arm DNA-binding domain-containing protein [Deltaproteobacteria bacterium]|nr:Arm DNA-binding domain-containing protein [Deltaproteobacteria bacterium]